MALHRAAALSLCAGLVSVTAVAAQQAQPVKLEPIAPIDLARVLDTYAAGRFDDAVGEVNKAGDTVGRRLRRHWSVTGRAWIDANPADRSHRALVAAALALETEGRRVERGDWGVSSMPTCAGPCVLDWAQAALVERGAPDAAERAWYLAAASLASGVRDWRYLQRTVDPVRQPDLLPGLMDRALDRFPGDLRLQLEQALAAASRFSIVDDDSGPATIIRAGPGLGRLGLPGGLMGPTSQETAARLLTGLVDDAGIGAEARMRLGYLRWALGQPDDARAELTKAAAQARDPDVQYLAEFLLGWTAMIRGESAEARTHLEAALAIRPGSQSAAVTLASIELQDGNAAEAHAVAQAAMDRRTDVDPWRLFLYGHHSQLAARIAELRRQVRP